ncbi:head decoration protein [Nocardioides sp. ChNu-153]|uniref:head decoration protein n=1 Tax=unclassified Nocardioides TaxID=2615069 RepID=UPI002405D5B1|nr:MULTISPECIES: head decoration protein [unclassified Nocardioides]MDF9718112.1 head decoration protein [Nocardioides sp. ChNu-99]MDN7120297.1 head decoration protein [Nocardioides sp. ChNu-153]
MDLSVRIENFGQDDQTWIGAAHGIDLARSITLDTSAFTAATHYPNGYIRGGTPLGKITATGLYGPYDNAAADGRETLAGFLLTPTKPGAVPTADVQAPLYEHGRVVEVNLPIAIDAAGKADVDGRITFE